MIIIMTVGDAEDARVVIIIVMMTMMSDGSLCFSYTIQKSR